MTGLMLTEDERLSVADFVSSPAYKKLLAYAIEQARNGCEAPSDRILYLQGIVGGVRQFGRWMESHATPPVTREVIPGEVQEKFRSTTGRKA